MEKRITVALREEAHQRLTRLKQVCKAMGTEATNRLIFSSALTIYEWYLNGMVANKPQCPGCRSQLSVGFGSCPKCTLKLRWMAAVEPSSPYQELGFPSGG